MALTPLEELKIHTLETGEESGGESCGAPSATPRMFTDAELAQILELHQGNVRAAAYDILIKKSVSTKVTLAGMTTAEQEKYWLRLAARVRPNHSGAIERADQP